MANGTVYRINSTIGPAGGGVTDAVIVEIWAYAKYNPKYPYNVPNEMIAAGLGSILRLGIPPHGLFRDPSDSSKVYFGTVDFNEDRTKLPPMHLPDLVVKLPFESAGLLLFDVLIANPDRHPGNIAGNLSSSPGCIHVFDHGHALFGYQAFGGIARLTELEDRLGITGGSVTQQHRHCLLDLVTEPSHFEEWLSRIEAIPDFYIRELCQEQISFGIAPGEALKMEQFLCHRKRTIRDLVKGNKAEFRGIKDWGLLA